MHYVLTEGFEFNAFHMVFLLDVEKNCLGLIYKDGLKTLYTFNYMSHFKEYELCTLNYMSTFKEFEDNKEITQR